MLARMLAIGIALIFIGASESATSAQSDTGGIKGRGVKSTPTILVGKHGGKLTAVDAAPTDVNGYKQAIDGVLGQA